jgi:PAS domain S-box-containing protein
MSGESPSPANEHEQQRLLTALRESEILRELAELLASSLDLKRTLRVLTQRTAEVCEIERCSVWLASDACRHVFQPAAYYISTQQIEPQQISAADQIWDSGAINFDDPDLYELLDEHVIAFLPDLRARPSVRHVAETFAVCSTLLVALKREGRIVGMLSLDDPGKTRTFSREQQQLARAIGQQAALAIDNARLYQEAQKARKRSERLIERAQAIKEVAVSVNSGADLQVVLEIAARRLVNGLGARSGAIALLQSGVLRVHSGHNLPASLSPAGPPADLADLPHFQEAVSDRKSLFVPSQQAAEAEKVWFSGLRFEQVLIVPLLVGASTALAPAQPTCNGFALMNFSSVGDAPGGGRLAFAQDIAAQCAIAVEKAQLLGDLHRAAALANERVHTLDAVFQAMTEGIAVLDLDGQVLVRNAAASHFLGVPVNTSQRLETFLQQHPVYSLHGQPVGIEEFPLTRALKGERIRGERFVTTSADGVERVLEVNVTPMLDEAGQQIGLASAFRDITEQTRAERRIRQALETMLHVAEAVSGITEIKDILYSVLQRTLLTLNCHRGLVQLYDADQQMFTPLMSIGFSTETEAQWLLDQSLWLTPEQQHDHDFPAQLRDGHATVIRRKQRLDAADAMNPVLVLAAPIVHHDRLMGLMMLDRSPTTRSGTLLESERREFSIWDMAVIEGIAQLTGLAIEQARLLQMATNARTSEAAMREANALKDDFLAITAHEFRSPLTVILAHTQMALRQLRRLSDQQPNSNLVDSLTSIEGQAHQLTNIVNTFLEVTLLNSGQLVVKAEVVDLADIASQVAASHGATSLLHEISCTIASADHPYLVRGDSSRLAQIIANLLQNALKYSPLGGPIAVTLRQYTSDASAHRRTIEVSVTDRGIGIPREDLPRLFERFYRAQNTVGSKTKGIGLGLYGVAGLLHLQGGAIRAESSGVLGEGSRFIFTLPALESDTNTVD